MNNAERDSAYRPGGVLKRPPLPIVEMSLDPMATANTHAPAANMEREANWDGAGPAYMTEPEVEFLDGVEEEHVQVLSSAEIVEKITALGPLSPDAADNITTLSSEPIAQQSRAVDHPYEKKELIVSRPRVVLENGFISDPDQIEAAYTEDGPTLTLGGAGSSKTTVIVERVARIVNASPEGRMERARRILVLTFSVAAAENDRRRIADRLGEEMPVEVHNYHRFCLNLLRSDPELYGLKKGFTITNPDAVLLLMDEAINQLKPNCHLTAEKVAEWTARVKCAYTSPQKTWQQIRDEELERGMDPDIVGYARDVALLYADRMDHANSIDFADMIRIPVGAWIENKKILAGVAGRFDHIIVDEVQDADGVQAIMVEELALAPNGAGRNLYCTGDDQQNVSDWRGSREETLTTFLETYSPTDETAGLNLSPQILSLSHNYRSTAQIVAAGIALTDHNSSKMIREVMVPDRQGEFLDVIEFPSQEAEYRYLAQKVRQSSATYPGKTAAILCRYHNQAQAIAKYLASAGVMFTYIDQKRTIDSNVCQNILAFFQLSQNPHDNHSFLRVAKIARPQISDAFMDSLWTICDNTGVSLISASSEIISSTSVQCDRDDLADIQGVLNVVDWLYGMRNNDPGRFYDEVVRSTPLRNHSSRNIDSSDPTAADQADNDLRFIDTGFALTTAKYASIQELLDGIHLREIEPDALDQVTIMTAHGSKGLEFDRVFIPDMVENSFPSRKSIEKGPDAVQSERRLAYTALQRARDHVTFTWSPNRDRYTQKRSRFIDEMPTDVLNFQHL
jgi:DNA helicase-2/ATP-dependent DNA helicase PcrA